MIKCLPVSKSGLVFDRRGEVLWEIYLALLTVSPERELAKVHGVTWQKFVAWAKDSIVVGCEFDGRVAGGMVFKNGDVHLGINPTFRSRWLRYFRPMLAVGFALFGPRMTARVGTENLNARRFVEHVGCVRRGGNSVYIEYDVIQERMRYGRNR